MIRFLIRLLLYTIHYSVLCIVIKHAAVCEYMYLVFLPNKYLRTATSAPGSRRPLASRPPRPRRAQCPWGRPSAPPAPGSAPAAPSPGSAGTSTRGPPGIYLRGRRTWMGQTALKHEGPKKITLLHHAQKPWPDSETNASRLHFTLAFYSAFTHPFDQKEWEPDSNFKPILL